MKVRWGDPSISARMVRAILAIALVPLVVLAAANLASLQRLSGGAQASVDTSREALKTQVVTAGLERTAKDIAVDLDRYLIERVDDVYVWASDPVTRGAAVAGAADAQARGLKDRSIDDLERELEDDPSLGFAGRANEYLSAQVLRSKVFAELTFTDANGYNVAYSEKPADFVQSDEDWWQAAWSRGADVAPVSYDPSARVFSTSIAVRINDDGGGGIGVLRAVLSLGAVQEIADLHREDRNVTVLNEQGLILAETATRHDPARVMNPDLTHADLVDPQITEAVAAAKRDGSSSVVTDEVSGGAAVTGRSQPPIGEFAGFDWAVLVDQPTSTAFAPVSSVAQVQRDISRALRSLLVLVLAVVLGAAVAAALGAVVLGSQIVRPILRLRDYAREVSTTRLPALVSAIERLPANRPQPYITPIDLRTGDELQELADEFDSVVSTAGRLAAEQVVARRRDLTAVFVTMGRRNQSLLGRQLELLDGMERDETDPGVLENLFEIDQLSTRLRRNAENLLVLAGEPPSRTWSRPVPVYDVVRGAVSEIEDYERVELAAIQPAFIRGGVVADLAHLLAELCENATRFSPPGNAIEIAGGPRGSGYRISITDHGPGMNETELAVANHKLADPEGFTRAPPGSLGLFVVGRLAARLGAEVRLFDSGAEGLVARVTLPARVLAAGPDDVGPVDVGPDTAGEEPVAEPGGARRDGPLADRVPPDSFLTAVLTGEHPAIADAARNGSTAERVAGTVAIDQEPHPPDPPPAPLPSPPAELAPPELPHRAHQGPDIEDHPSGGERPDRSGDIPSEGGSEGSAAAGT